mmetsp:Transcript_15756/g.32668  ORF Transcript_15756/g.32668 Transcript_15756/m.32668 type:complete len:280 (-) Transcript_15756:160-999(-)
MDVAPPWMAPLMADPAVPTDPAMDVAPPWRAPWMAEDAVPTPLEIDAAPPLTAPPMAEEAAPVDSASEWVAALVVSTMPDTTRSMFLLVVATNPPSEAWRVCCVSDRAELALTAVSERDRTAPEAAEDPPLSRVVTAVCVCVCVCVCACASVSATATLPDCSSSTSALLAASTAMLEALLAASTASLGVFRILLLSSPLSSCCRIRSRLSCCLAVVMAELGCVVSRRSVSVTVVVSELVEDERLSRKLRKLPPSLLESSAIASSGFVLWVAVAVPLCSE